MIEELEIRKYSPRTIEVYVGMVARFANDFGLSFAVLGPDQVRDFQVYLASERKVSSSVLNQAVCALRFLYRQVLYRPGVVSRIPYARKPKEAA